MDISCMTFFFFIKNNSQYQGHSEKKHFYEYILEILHNNKGLYK